jgi:uncharacterized protein YndB with AHSA1/START domain
MTFRTLWVIAHLALVTFAFSVVFVIATLAGLSIPFAVIAGEAAAIALAVASLVMSLVPATIIQEERLTIKAPREAVYAAIVDPRSAPRLRPDIVAVDDLVGEPGVVGTRWRTTEANGMVFTAEVVAAEPPARVVTRSRHDPPWPRRGLIIEAERTLVATPAGTELTIRMVMYAVLWHQLIVRLRRSQATRMRRWMNDRFREKLEAGAEN